MARRSARKAAQVVLVARPSPPDAAGARQRQTLRAGSIWLKSFGFRLGRGATTTFTETLDLEPNGLRQSDPVFTGNALALLWPKVVLVARFIQHDGYRCLSLTRASGVVKCQFALVC
jgi:hypothetical protein